jgi:hypothetical protein
MSWKDLAELCHREMDNLVHENTVSLRGLVSSLEQIPRALAELERECGNTLDTAVMEFSISRTWPELDQREKSLLYYRLEFGYATANLLATAANSSGRSIFGDTSREFAEAELIQWLLIGAWHDEGFKQMHSWCIELLREDAVVPTPALFSNN